MDNTIDPAHDKIHTKYIQEFYDKIHTRIFVEYDTLKDFFFSIQYFVFIVNHNIYYSNCIFENLFLNNLFSIYHKIERNEEGGGVESRGGNHSSVLVSTWNHWLKPFMKVLWLTTFWDLEQLQQLKLIYDSSYLYILLFSFYGV